MTRPTRWFRRLLMTAAVGLALTGCQPGEPGLGDARVGMEAQDFVVQALVAEGPQRLSDYQGEVILMDFWGSSCPPCRRSMPEIEALHAELEGQFQLLSINVDGPDPDRAQNVRRFLDDLGITHDVWLDNGRASAAYGVSRIPLVVIVDRNWQVARVFQGYTEPRQLRQALQSVIAEGT